MVVYTLPHVIFITVLHYLHFIDVMVLVSIILILQIWKMRLREIKQFGHLAVKWIKTQNPELFLFCSTDSWNLRIRLLLAASKTVAKLKWLKLQECLVSYLMRSPEVGQLQGCLAALDEPTCFLSFRSTVLCVNYVTIVIIIVRWLQSF